MIRNYILEKQNNLKIKLIQFFKDNPDPSDKEVHAYANQLGIDEHKFEEVIYDLIGEFAGAGLAKEKGITEKDVDSKELAMGIKVEMEHTTNKYLARRIAIDHLAEIPDYYTRLEKMEKEAGVKEAVYQISGSRGRSDGPLLRTIKVSDKNRASCPGKQRGKAYESVRDYVLEKSKGCKKRKLKV